MSIIVLTVCILILIITTIFFINNKNQESFKGFRCRKNSFLCNSEQEGFAYPFLSIRNTIQRRRGISPCVQGCVIQTRRGQFIDHECSLMCRNWYTDKFIPNTNYGYEVSQTSKYDPNGKTDYVNQLNDQINEYKSSMQFSTIGQ